jgi:RNA recognition motif-containing protein
MFVANLNSNLSNEQLASDVADLFSKYGEITHVKVSRDSYNRPFAFVQFLNGELISEILGKKHYLHSRTLRIERTKSNSTLKIHSLSQLSYRSTEEIENFLSNFGPIEKLSVHREQLTCTFTTKQAALNALLSLKNSGVSCSLSKPIAGVIIVRNLPFCTLDEISDIFSPFGQILNISPIDVSGMKNSYSDSVLVKFKNLSDALGSVSLDCSEWKSKILRVSLYESYSNYVYPIYPFYFYDGGSDQGGFDVAREP